MTGQLQEVFVQNIESKDRKLWLNYLLEMLREYAFYYEQFDVLHLKNQTYVVAHNQPIFLST